MPIIELHVIGHEGVGKTNFINEMKAAMPQYMIREAKQRQPYQKGGFDVAEAEQLSQDLELPVVLVREMQR